MYILSRRFIRVKSVVPPRAFPRLLQSNQVRISVWGDLLKPGLMDDSRNPLMASERKWRLLFYNHVKVDLGSCRNVRVLADRVDIARPTKSGAGCECSIPTSFEATIAQPSRFAVRGSKNFPDRLLLFFLQRSRVVAFVDLNNSSAVVLSSLIFVDGICCLRAVHELQVDASRSLVAFF
jgi:hypothetical protein